MFNCDYLLLLLLPPTNAHDKHCLTPVECPLMYIYKTKPILVILRFRAQSIRITSTVLFTVRLIFLEPVGKAKKITITLPFLGMKGRSSFLHSKLSFHLWTSPWFFVIPRLSFFSLIKSPALPHMCLSIKITESPLPSLFFQVLPQKLWEHWEN